MALINSISNQASVTYDGQQYDSNTATTLLLLPPTILKAVDKLTASIGEELTYTITITNVALSEITNLPFQDILPNGIEFVEDSFTLNGTDVTPTLTNDTLTYTIQSIAALGIATISFRVEVIGGEE